MEAARRPGPRRLERPVTRLSGRRLEVPGRGLARALPGAGVERTAAGAKNPGKSAPSPGLEGAGGNSRQHAHTIQLFVLQSGKLLEERGGQPVFWSPAPGQCRH